MLDASWSTSTQAQVAERLAKPGLGRWLTQVQQVRRCAHPVRLALGTDAHNRGANCELIPDTLPGVAYVAQDGIPDPVRVRFAWHSDATIAELVNPVPVVEGPVLTVVGDAA